MECKNSNIHVGQINKIIFMSRALKNTMESLLARQYGSFCLDSDFSSFLFPRAVLLPGAHHSDSRWVWFLTKSRGTVAPTDNFHPTARLLSAQFVYLIRGFIFNILTCNELFLELKKFLLRVIMNNIYFL